jgi:NTE family protein
LAAPTTLRAWLAAEPFALGLSSGFFGFFAHTGLVSVLEDEGLFPGMLVGSSAGALVAGLWSAGVPAERIGQELLSLHRRDFWDPGPGLGLLRGGRFRNRLKRLLPVERFDQCRWPLAVSSFDVLARKTRVLNSGDLARAIHASCAVPLLFQPVWLDRRPHLDGGLSDRHGLCGLPDSRRLLYHHLASRSPWRRPSSPAMRLPERADTVSLVIQRLPRSGPFRLQAGRLAFEQARQAARRALDMPVRDGRVQLCARIEEEER